ncbi:MAG TPA: cytochrome P450 [Polyangiaceae bacterium]|nr:cytochrome P450 [Polyangiaceae bacterium]
MKTVRDIPALSGERLTGHIAEFRQDQGGLLRRLQQECGDIGTLRFFNMRVPTLNSPELIHEAFIEKAKSFRKSAATRIVFYPLAGKGLFSSEGELWRRQRKLMAPLFHPAAVRGYAETMNAVIGRYLDEWRDGQLIDVGREMTRITMAVVGKVLFDADTFDEADELGAAIQVMFHYLIGQVGTPSLFLKAPIAAYLLDLRGLPPWAEALRDRALGRLAMPLRLPTGEGRRVYEALERLDSSIQRTIAERRRIGLSRPDFLSRLLNASDEDDGSVMTDRQVRDEALTLFVAGHETTAAGTTWSLYFLGRNPEVYRRWKDEAASLGGKVPGAEDALRLSYTLGVFKEALRLYPPAALVDRLAIEDVEIGGYLLPRHSPLFICPYALHRRPDLWPDPERFDPDRFTREAESKRHRLAWMPFGAGPRVCIGAQFATLEAQLLLAQIAQRFELEPVSAEPVEPNFETTLRPSKPVLLRVKKAAQRAVQPAIPTA